ncbi:MAG TPA: PAS domain-containing protein [Candidatus Sulfotelmatobacter sp.]|nr:PAS domain-containing protein [Candidatus Sulfotelmatobacter sp.]
MKRSGEPKSEIAQRKKIEERLLKSEVALQNAFDEIKKSEAKLRRVIDTIPTLAWCNLADGPNEFLSRRWHEYTGLSPEESHGWGWQVAFHPDDLPALMKTWQELLVSGEPGEIEARLRRHDGIYRWFLIRVEPFRDDNGKIDRWYGTSTDIEDRKQAEQALQSSQRNLSSIINTMPTFAWSARPDGSADFLNDRWLEYAGLSATQALDWKWLTAIHPDDLNHLTDYWRSIMVTGEPGEIEVRIRRFDGEYRWFLIRANAVRDESGAILKWYGTNTDIDDRKRAEARGEEAYLRLAEAQRLSKTGSFITDLLADNHDWSEEAFRIFEFDPSTKVTVQMIRDIVHPEDLPTFDAVIARGMSGTDVDFVFRIVLPRGVVKHIRGMARVMVQVGGHPLFIGALQDVTESKAAEAALDRARSELSHVARVSTLNTLTASIAHEINQPLSGIITNAGTCLRMLSGDPPNIDGARETARRTLRDGNRASDVISRLRTLYSRKEFTLEPLDLNEAIREVIALSLSDLQRNRVVMRTELAENLPSIIGDRIQLQQVTLNLFRNASEAMIDVEDRPRQLLIRTAREADDRVRLSVQDAGIGVNPEDLGKLFEAFYSTKMGGMGIGLSVCRSIIERHHGRLWAEPNDGPGLTFSFSIPCGLESPSSTMPM